MSSQSLNQNTVHYLNYYLEKTLGVSQILNQFQDKQLIEQKCSANAKSEIDLGFFIEDYSSYTALETELLLKMVSAMNLNSNQYCFFDLAADFSPDQKMSLSEKKNQASKYQIYFKDHPENQNETYSPRMLLQKPEFKKHTWDFLKIVMKKIN